MEPTPQHPSRPLLHPMIRRAAETVGDAAMHSKMPDADFKRLLLMIDQFQLTLSDVIDALDPYGEKLHRYQEVLDVEYFDQHHRERMAKSLESIWNDPEDGPDAPNPPAQPPSAKFREAAQTLLDLLHLTPPQRERIEQIFDEHYQHIDALTENLMLAHGFIGTILDALTPEESARVMALIEQKAKESTTKQ